MFNIYTQPHTKRRIDFTSTPDEAHVSWLAKSEITRVRLSDDNHSARFTINGGEETHLIWIDEAQDINKVTLYKENSLSEIEYTFFMDKPANIDAFRTDKTLMILSFNDEGFYGIINIDETFT
jgi:hypothetical protein